LSHEFQVNFSFSSDIGTFWSFPGIQLGFNGHFMNFRRIPKFLDGSGHILLIVGNTISIQERHKCTGKVGITWAGNRQSYYHVILALALQLICKPNDGMDIFICRELH
jgi:hypothetical protein